MTNDSVLIGSEDDSEHHSGLSLCILICNLIQALSAANELRRRRVWCRKLLADLNRVDSSSILLDSLFYLFRPMKHKNPFLNAEPHSTDWRHVHASYIQQNTFRKQDLKRHLCTAFLNISNTTHPTDSQVHAPKHSTQPSHSYPPPPYTPHLLQGPCQPTP
jgi:hypothetical protein